MLHGLECKIHPNFKNKTQEFKDADTLDSCSDSPLNAIIQFSVMPYYKKFEKGYLRHLMCMTSSYLLVTF